MLSDQADAGGPFGAFGQMPESIVFGETWAEMMTINDHGRADVGWYNQDSGWRKAVATRRQKAEDPLRWRAQVTSLVVVYEAARRSSGVA
jgi:hypothetical protein